MKLFNNFSEKESPRALRQINYQIPATNLQKGV